MAKQKQLPQSKNLKKFISNFEKEFLRKPTDTETWSYFEGQIQIFDSFLKSRNKPNN